MSCTRRAALGRGRAGVFERQLDVLEHGQFLDQVEALEDEADLPAPQRVQRASLQPATLLAFEPVLAGRRHVEQAEDGQQRRLAAAGRPGDGHVFAGGDLEVDAVERRGLDFARRVDLADA
jgi:hypothetical protein